MRTHGAVCALCAVAALLPLPARGQAFRGLGLLDPSDPTPYSRALAVSADGTTVVGESCEEAFLWTVTAPATLQSLGSLSPGEASGAYGVSADGSVVVGGGGPFGGGRAFRWTSGGGMVSLGTLEGDGSSSAAGVSGDGAVVVGHSSSDQGLRRGFRWTQGGGMTPLDPLPFPGKDALATAVSGDGNVAVGRGGCCANGGAVVSVRWPAGGSVAESLGDLCCTGPESPWGAAAGISADGLVIVGGGGAPSRAYRWSGGIMTELAPSAFPPPDGTKTSSALAASGDGSVIVGSASKGAGASVFAPVGTIEHGRAFIWTASDGMRPVEDVLIELAPGLGAVLTNWRLEAATGISADGNVIVGYGMHNDVREAWVAARAGAPFPSSPPEPPDPSDCDPDPPDPPGVFRQATFFAALRESHGFLWHPTKGPVPILPDPPPPFLDPAAEGVVHWVEGVASPRAAEQLWAVRSETPTGEAELRLLRHHGCAWEVDWTSRGAGDALLASPGFDLVYEDHSGDAIAVYESGAGTPRYRTYSAGRWSEEQGLPLAEASPQVAGLGEGIVQWIELAARPGTDEVALAYLDDRGHLLVWLWDGRRWLGDAAVLLADGLRPGATRGPRARPSTGSRPFDIAYEALSGALVAAWARPGHAGFHHARRSTRSGAWSRPVRAFRRAGRVDFVDLASEPTSNLVAGAFMSLAPRLRGHSRTRVALSLWDSVAWRHRSIHGGSVELGDRSPSALPGALVWSGTSRVALFAHAGQTRGSFAWARWTETGWSVQPTVSLPGAGWLASVRLSSSADQGGLLGVVSDREAQLLGVHYDGEGGAWRPVSEGPLAQGLHAPDHLPFGLALAREPLLLIGDPAAGRRRRVQGLGGVTVELLSFTLAPRAGAHRVEQMAIELHHTAGLDRDSFRGASLVVDANADGRLDADETTTVGGRGLMDPAGRLVFFDPFDVTAPTHYVLRSTLPSDERRGPLTVLLRASGMVVPRGVVRGEARRQLELP